MTKAVFRGAAPSINAALVAVLAITGCSGLSAPIEQSVSGLSPAGSVTIKEDFVTRLGGGTGTLYYQKQSYPFKLAGTVAGLGGGLRRSTPRARSTSSPASLISWQVHAKFRGSRFEHLWWQRFVAAKQRQRDHAPSRHEYWGDADSRARRDLYPDDSVIQSFSDRETT